MRSTIKNNKGKKLEKSIHVDDFKREYLRDKEIALLYLNEALAQNDMALFRDCLKELIRIHGGISSLAETLNVSRQNIEQCLSEKGGLKIGTMTKHLEFVGLRLKVEKAT